LRTNERNRLQQHVSEMDSQIAARHL
jgi:hypothetical protein